MFASKRLSSSHATNFHYASLRENMTLLHYFLRGLRILAWGISRTGVDQKNKGSGSLPSNFTALASIYLSERWLKVGSEARQRNLVIRLACKVVDLVLPKRRNLTFS